MLLPRLLRCGSEIGIARTQLSRVSCAVAVGQSAGAVDHGAFIFRQRASFEILERVIYGTVSATRARELQAPRAQSSDGAKAATRAHTDRVRDTLRETEHRPQRTMSMIDHDVVVSFTVLWTLGSA